MCISQDKGRFFQLSVSVKWLLYLDECRKCLVNKTNKVGMHDIIAKALYVGFGPGISEQALCLGWVINAPKNCAMKERPNSDRVNCVMIDRKGVTACGVCQRSEPGRCPSWAKISTVLSCDRQSGKVEDYGSLFERLRHCEGVVHDAGLLSESCL